MKTSIRRLSAIVALAMTAALALPAAARTVYRDRIVPVGVCMVEFEGMSINAALILEVSYGLQNVRVGEVKFGFMGDESKFRRATFLKVVMVNGSAYNKEFPEDRAEAAKQAFLNRIKETCHDDGRKS